MHVLPVQLGKVVMISVALLGGICAASTGVMSRLSCGGHLGWMYVPMFLCYMLHVACCIEVIVF